jgi:predicted small metal-binding protein
MDASGDQLKKQARLHFKCSDVVAKNCDWQVSGNSEREIMPLIEQHSQEKHGLKLDDETLNGVHNAILKRVA